MPSTSSLYRPRTAVFAVSTDNVSQIPLLSGTKTKTKTKVSVYSENIETINALALSNATNAVMRKPLANLRVGKPSKNIHANKENVAPFNSSKEMKGKNKLGKSLFNISPQEPQVNLKLAEPPVLPLDDTKRLGITPASNLVRDMTNEPFEKSMIVDKASSKSPKLNQQAIVSTGTWRTPNRREKMLNTLHLANQRCKALTESPLADLSEAFRAIAVKRQSKNSSLPAPPALSFASASQPVTPIIDNFGLDMDSGAQNVNDSDINNLRRFST